MTTSTRRGFGRARVVAVQTALGCGLAAAALDGPQRWALGAAGVATATAGLLRLRGRWADAHLAARLRRDAFAPDGVERPDPDLGLAATLLPALEVGEATGRNGPPLGVLCDGRGYAAALALPPRTLPDLPVGLLDDWLAQDAARPAAVQLLVEQFGLPAWDFHRRFEPTLAYRHLPRAHAPVAVRAHLVLRYEPWEAPEVAEARGGGAPGARAALVGATARLRARLAAARVPAEPLSAAALRELLRGPGDPGGDGHELPDSFTAYGSTHCTLAAHVATAEDWAGLLTAAGAALGGTERTVAAATVSRAGGHPEVRAALRLVDSVPQRAAETRDRLLEHGPLRALTGKQRTGLAATLPLAHPPRSLAAATGFATEAEAC
ncbi:type VII secretion protein EccE [Streptomyces sp. TRM70308]|uniref:type VII secretion protein EccE n=1 Tax=Streptomyces sp. TRM70308 TaxID=3131932 RepID=UPI003CFC9A71